VPAAIDNQADAAHHCGDVLKRHPRCPTFRPWAKPGQTFVVWAGLAPPDAGAVAGAHRPRRRRHVDSLLRSRLVEQGVEVVALTGGARSTSSSRFHPQGRTAREAPRPTLKPLPNAGTRA
jgi:hypothetical protein